MSPPSDLIQKKASSAFYTDDQLAEMGYSSSDILEVLIRLLRGGLWIGGNTTLTSTKLIFELNTFNKLFHPGNLRIEIPLVDISPVRVKSSWGRKIIQIASLQRNFQIRVKGAKEFADLINETIAKAKSGIA